MGFAKYLTNRKRRELRLANTNRFHYDLDQSAYAIDLAKRLDIRMTWIEKLPFHTIRWAYFGIIRSRDPEREIEYLKKFFREKIFDSQGNVKPRDNY